MLVKFTVSGRELLIGPEVATSPPLVWTSRGCFFTVND